MDNGSNALARYKLLRKALKGDKQIPAALLRACRSQGGLAKLDLPSMKITPMALNTLKTKANDLIEEGGWRELDEMRKAYLKAGNTGTTKASSVQSKSSSLKTTVDELEAALKIERQYRLRLQTAYGALLARLRSAARDDPDLAHFINRHVTGFAFKRLAVVGSEEGKVDG